MHQRGEVTEVDYTWSSRGTLMPGGRSVMPVILALTSTHRLAQWQLFPPEVPPPPPLPLLPLLLLLLDVLEAVPEVVPEVVPKVLTPSRRASNGRTTRNSESGPRSKGTLR